MMNNIFKHSQLYWFAAMLIIYEFTTYAANDMIIFAFYLGSSFEREHQNVYAWALIARQLYGLYSPRLCLNSPQL